MIKYFVENIMGYIAPFRDNKAIANSTTLGRFVTNLSFLLISLEQENFYKVRVRWISL
jgi:hypothetical protein